jgi:hypothetical protein
MMFAFLAQDSVNQFFRADNAGWMAGKRLASFTD